MIDVFKDQDGHDPLSESLRRKLQIELLSEARIKSAVITSPYKFQLACDACGYLPTKKAEEGGHYSAYVTSGITGHVGGEILTRKTISEINEMFK